MKNLNVSYKDKNFCFNHFDVYELKQLTEYFYGSYFFSRETLKFFGQTLKNSYLYKEKNSYKNIYGELIPCYVVKMWSSKTKQYTYYKFSDENHEKPFSYLSIE